MSESAAQPHDAADSHDNPILHFLHELHAPLSGIEFGEGLAHLGSTHAEAGPFSLLGLPLGGINMGLGINEVSHGEGSQGSLDILAGGLQMTSSFAALTGAAAAPPLAIAAAVAGMGAYGNKDAQAEGWYGKDREGHNNTFLGSIRDTAADGQSVGVDFGRSILGNNVVGDVAGGMLGNTLGGLGGIGQALWNSTAAVGTGIGRMASNQVDFAREHPILGGLAVPGAAAVGSIYDFAQAATR